MHNEPPPGDAVMYYKPPPGDAVMYYKPPPSTYYSLYISLFCMCVCHNFNKENLLLLNYYQVMLLCIINHHQVMLLCIINHHQVML